MKLPIAQQKLTVATNITPYTFRLCLDSAVSIAGSGFAHELEEEEVALLLVREVCVVDGIARPSLHRTSCVISGRVALGWSLSPRGSESAGPMVIPGRQALLERLLALRLKKNCAEVPARETTEMSRLDADALVVGAAVVQPAMPPGRQPRVSLDAPAVGRRPPAIHPPSAPPPA